jgi:hypothetical protein
MKLLDEKFLSDLGFVRPNIVPYKQDNNEVKFIESHKNSPSAFLYLQNNSRWMCLNSNLFEVFNMYSHYKLARGHCICTGMGFLLRENWLLSKKEVEKITVIEKNKFIIDYHKKFNPDILDKIEVIHMDAFDFRGKCDTFLADNFEGPEHLEVTFLKAFKIMNENIKNEVSWMWPLESTLNKHYKNYIGLSLLEIYNNIKKFFELKTLPNLTEEELFEFCKIYYMGDFNKCDFSRIKDCEFK